MDIGRINDRLINNAITSSKNRAVDDDFEKRLKNAMDKNDEKELKEACQEFESIFLSMMYRQLKASVPRTDLIPGDIGRDIFESMLDDRLMEEASKNSGIGLADSLYKQLHRRLKSVYKPNSAGEEQIGEKK